jgi:hypothetical protein
MSIPDTLVRLLFGLLLIAVSGALALALQRIWRSGRPGPGRTIPWDITFFVAIGHVVLFMLVPGMLRLANDWKADIDVLVTPEEILVVYLIELASFLIWGGVLLATSRSPRLSAAPISATGTADSVTRIFLVLIMTVGIVITAEMVLNRSTVDSGRFGAADAKTLTDRYLWPLSPLGLQSGSVVGCYVLARGRKTFGGLTWLVAAIALVLYLATFGLSGVRGALVWPVLWTILILRVFASRRRWLWSAMPLLAGVVALVFVQGAVLGLRNAGSDATVSEKIDEFKATGGSDDPLDTVEFRLGSASRYSVGFVRMWDAGDGAEWRPIANTLYAPFPRAFMPQKPWPTSRDGDEYSMGMYLIMSEIHHRTSFSMTEFLTGCHAYWEFGAVGVLLLSAVAGFYARFAMWFSSRFRHAGPAILLYFFKPWGYNNPKLWVSDIMLELVQLVPAALLLWYTAKAIALLANRSGRLAEPAPGILGTPSDRV